jgi:hypothetical protein
VKKFRSIDLSEELVVRGAHYKISRYIWSWAPKVLANRLEFWFPVWDRRADTGWRVTHRADCWLFSCAGTRDRECFCGKVLLCGFWVAVAQMDDLIEGRIFGDPTALKFF